MFLMVILNLNPLDDLQTMFFSSYIDSKSIGWNLVIKL